ncbi:hypothetical protein PF005_g29636 [Phytophthora fragariae]|uniref:Uncharacterized protein n=2 Tax=Phytophthora fragariae TaxID=53985 RepID=A0A6A3Q746_9STRA|nr:hypothetical protein PF003_g30651 [Phytophthora fragariae]KAE8919694.1 hypothetical protein PF009_g30003 [Phytophthora fragariae]KAE8964376.1 hypothetical protein PF011_g28692 [Phytophthora fragariae]KAE9063755.1 hypothetical protein PF007_g29443 [Phytophthora fragariae]KAE9070557.1 hypothetical protein PF006_g29337 [Phytophthora fragariae]
MAPLIINLTTKKQLKVLEDELGGKLFSSANGVRGLHFQF